MEELATETQRHRGSPRRGEMKHSYVTIPFMAIEHRMIKTNGIQLHCAMDGPENGVPVFLLHGFPDFWYGWRHQIAFLSSQGYRVIAPDQRGYNTSEKPDGVAAYNIDQLAADVVGLLDSFQYEKAFLVGHDWGGMVAWRAVARYPLRFHKVAILNVPHPSVLKQEIRSNWRQKRKSWYIFFFQLPWLPEQVGRFANWSILTSSLKRSSRADTFSADDFRMYKEAWLQPGAFHAMIQWYRALLKTRAERLPNRRVTIPLLMLWGAQDHYLGREMIQPSMDLCDQGSVKIFEDTSHWIQHEQPDRVNQLLLELFT